MDQFKKNYTNYSSDLVNRFLTTHSFKLNDFEDEFKLALRTEPSVVNGLLYRSYNSKENFEEDTFLDLYIYQTARKSGKATTGVENYIETEKVVLEAYTDMVDEKKKVHDTGSDSFADIEKKTEHAYRKGDLDLLDSLQNILMGSEAFRNKFLIKRNDIQAYSIDTLIQKNTAFIGVGAAHLPGEKGVDENLMKKENELADGDDSDDNSKESLFTDFNSKIYTYAKLLIPFYDKEILVKKFFDKLLYSKNQNIQLLTATVMLNEKNHVPDSLLQSLASNDHYRAPLYRLLKRIDREDKFPAAFKNQQLMARSLLISAGDYERIDSILLVKTITTTHLNDTGQILFYKYRVKKDDLWKMAFSGFQPKDKKMVSTNSIFTVFSEKALDYETPELEQFEKKFRKLQISSRKSGKYFYLDEDYKIF